MTDFAGQLIIGVIFGLLLTVLLWEGMGDHGD